MRDDYSKLDDDQADAFNEMKEPTQEKFLALNSDEKNDVIEVDTDTRDAYVEKFSELDRDEKKYLKTMETKPNACSYLMLFKLFRPIYKAMSQEHRENYNNYFNNENNLRGLQIKKIGRDYATLAEKYQ